MDNQAAARERLGDELLGLYPSALPQVYGFLLARCHDQALAEDLTSDAFMAAVAAVNDGSVDSVSVGWLIVVARRRLVDYWRRLEVEQRSLRVIRDASDMATDPWDEVLDVEAARSALEGVRPNYRAALTLRYIDGLSVPEVAQLLGRSIHATEGVLQRARVALRRAYEEGAADEA